LNSASKLTAADPNGSSDPFVTVDWDGAQQQTKVVNRTLEPVWKQTLFFPLKLITLNTPALASKPPISIRVFDMDEAGHDLLGSCEIPLHRITSAEHAKIDDEFGTDGRAHRGRVFAQRQLPLTLPGHRIQSTINVELYFTPDLPLDIQLEEEAEHKAQDLNEEYMARLMPFYKSLPARTRSKLEKAMRFELGKGEEYELGKAQLKRLVSAEDQDAVEHLFCEYLSPQQPPTDMSDPMHIARMVRCVTWADDSVIFKKDSRKDVWQSPPFFMMMRQGDTEDHALLMCNLFLGLNLDAYVCVGRLRGCSEREKRHVWVMTRDPDGDVRIWETKTGTCLTLVERWYGKKLSAAERAEIAAAAAAAAASQEGGVADVAGKLGKAIGGGLKTIASVGQVIHPLLEDTPAAPMADDSGAPVAGRDDLLARAAEDMLDQLGDDLLTRDDVEASLEEIEWQAPDVAELEAMQKAQRRNEEDAMAEQRRQDRSELANEDGNDIDFQLPPAPQLLYESVEAIFNHKNLWISRTLLDPAQIRYDFEESGEWSAFVEPRMQSLGKPEAFYTPKRLSAKVPPDRLRSMEAQILGELKNQITVARSSGLTTTINKSAELVDALKRGIDLQESARLGDESAKKESKAWERDVKSRLPAGSTLKAKAVHFSYTDAKKIRKHLLSVTDYAEQRDDGIEFTIAVKAFAFHGGVVSVWVYFGMVDTNLAG